MGIKVIISGEATLENLAHIRQHLEPILDQELQRFGDEGVAYLQAKVKSGDFDIEPKKRDDEKPPLIDTEKYINSYKAFVEDHSLGLISVGMNTFMPNSDLAELLEFGWNHGPARPHLRPLALHMTSNAQTLGDRIFRALFGDH